MTLVVVSSMVKSRAALQLENVALRHQIGVLQRSAKKRLPLNNADRLFWIGLSRMWTEWYSALRIVPNIRRSYRTLKTTLQRFGFERFPDSARDYSTQTTRKYGLG
jgi:hypothetical protein